MASLDASPLKRPDMDTEMECDLVIGCCYVLRYLAEEIRCKHNEIKMLTNFIDTVWRMYMRSKE